MPCSFSQYASVPATSRNGRPDEKPKKNIVHAAGCANARQTEALVAASRRVAAVAHRVVHGVRRMVGKARRRLRSSRPSASSRNDGVTNW